eukprot:gene25373-biopygen19846
MARGIMQDLIPLALREMDDMDARSMSIVLGALVNNDVGLLPVSSELVQGILTRAKDKFDAHHQELQFCRASQPSPEAEILKAMGVACTIDGFDATWLSEAAQVLPGSDAQGLSNILGAATRMGIALHGAFLETCNPGGLPVDDWEDRESQNLAFVSTWLSVAEKKLPNFAAEELSTTLCALSKLSLDGHDTTPFIATWLSEAEQKLPLFNAEDLATTLHAAASASDLYIDTDSAFIASLMEMVETKLTEFNSPALVAALEKMERDIQ